MVYVNFLTCLITGLIAIYFVFLICKKRLALTEQEPFKKKNEFGILFILALLFLVAIRLYHFGTQPVWYYVDEAMSSYDAYSLMLYGTDHWGFSFPVHMYAWGWSQQSAIFTYMIVPFMKLVGYNMFATRLPLLLLSVVGAVFLALIVRDVLGDKMAIVALIICAFNPWHYVQSRYGIDCNVLPHVLIAGIFFLIHFIKTKKKRYLYIGTILMGLTFYSYMIAVYSIPILMIMVFIYFLRNKQISIKTFILNVITFLVVTFPIIILSVMMVTDAEHNIKLGIFTIPALRESERPQDILFMSGNILNQFCINVVALFKTIFLQAEKWPWDTIVHYGTMYKCMASMLFVGIIVLIFSFKKKYQKDYAWILLSYLVITVWVGVITADVTEIRRLNLFYYLGMILICYTIHAFSDKKVIYYGLIAMFFPLGMLMLYSYHHTYLETFVGPMSFSTSFPQALEKAAEFDADKYYINDDVLGPETGTVSEVYTLVAQKIDPQYRYGYKDYQYDNDTERMPYKEKYNYISVDEMKIDPNENAVYVVTEGEAEEFDSELFDVYSYGLYSVVVSKRYN